MSEKYVVYSNSLADPLAIWRKRAKSKSVSRPHPSAMFAGMELALRRSWLVRPYSSSLGNPVVTR